MVDAFDFYKSYAKLTYILTRIFRTLVAKGYCSDKSEESDSSDANADGTTFEDDVEGTGEKKNYKLISLKNVNIFINEIADLVPLQKN